MSADARSDSVEISGLGPHRFATVICPLILLGAMACGFLAYIAAFGVEVPYWDEWELLDRFRQFLQGNYRVLDLIAEKHNEHLIGAGFAYMLVHHLLSGFSVKAILLTDGLLQVGSLAILLRFAWRTMDPSAPRLWLLLPPAICMLSLTQYQNLLWGFQAPWFLITLALMVCLAALEQVYRLQPSDGRARWVGVAIVSAVVSSFCSFHGLIVWVAGLIFIFAKANLRFDCTLRDPTARVWLVAMAACLLAYTIVFRLTPGSGPTGSAALASLKHPVQLVLFVVFNLGSVWVGVGNRLAFAAGLLLVAVTALCVARVWSSANRATYALPLALIGYELVFAGLAAVGRLQLGLSMSRESHYTAYVPLLLVGDYLILIQGAGRTPTAPTLMGLSRAAFGAFLAIFFAVSTYGGIVRGYDWRAQRGVAASVLLDYQHAAPLKIERALFGNVDFVIRLADFLKTHRFSTFSDGAAAVPVDAIAYVKTPSSWDELNRTNPDMQEALARLWDVYGVGRDLQLAFDPSSKDFAQDLVRWAFGATRDGGDHYLRRYLLPYAQDYATLQARMPGK